MTSGLRLGTNTLAFRGMGAGEARTAGVLIDRVLRGDVAGVRAEVHDMLTVFPVDGPGSWART